MNNKVLVVVITKDKVQQECYDSILNQQYPDFDVLVSISKAKQYSTREDKLNEKMNNLYMNCAENRNKARKMALASEADNFLFVDSDVVLPVDTIDRLMIRNRPVTGGYYEIAPGSNRWVAGAFRENEKKQRVFINCDKPIPGLFTADMVGLGCALIKRKVLEKVEFEAGLGRYCLGGKFNEPTGMSYGECMAFGEDVQKAGFGLFMDGDIVCKHLK